MESGSRRAVTVCNGGSRGTLGVSFVQLPEVKKPVLLDVSGAALTSRA